MTPPRPLATALTSPSSPPPSQLPAPFLSLHQKLGMPEVDAAAEELAMEDEEAALLLEAPRKPLLPSDAGALARLRQLQKGVL